MPPDSEMPGPVMSARVLRTDFTRLSDSDPINPFRPVFFFVVSS